MALDMYSASVPVFTRMLRNLDALLVKAQASAEARKFDPELFLGARLAPDMLPLPRQIQIACDSAKGCAARLSGVEIPKFEDNESTLAELRQRIANTLAFIESVPKAGFEGSQGRAIEIPRRTGEPLHFNGEDYLRFYALPNLFFHVTTAYALLRHWGVGIGKRDYLGNP